MKVLKFLSLSCAVIFAGLLSLHGQEEQDSERYIIKPFDTLNLEVFGEPDLSTSSAVSVTGEATFPLLGTVKVSGKTIHEANETVHDLYAADYLINPQINLTVIGIAAERVTVMGAVNNPGEIVIPRDSPLDLVSALATSGGLQANADKARITLKRGQTTQTYNYDSLKRVGADQVILKQGDRIDVPVSPYANAKVTIVGEVRSPIVTAFPLEGKLSLQTLIGTVGGFTEQADKKRIVIERGSKRFNADLSRNRGPIALRPGDVVTVPRNELVGAVITMTGQVNSPGPLSFPLDGQLTLLGAVAQARGFTRLANRKKVSVTRSENGRQRVFSLNAADIADGGAPDFALRPGDSIFVPERLF